MNRNYRIYELSARTIISYAEEPDGRAIFHLNKQATQRSLVPGAAHEQEDNALFHQIMCVLHGDSFTVPKADPITDLSDAIVYVSFEHIFDRTGGRRYLDRQNKAEAMFRPEGISLDFGNGLQAYVAFERSGSMSRRARLSFLRADLLEPVRRRIMLDMSVGRCQLSKLYAYNGLMLSGGTRIEGIGITAPHRVIVIDNPTYTADNIDVITVEGGPVVDGVRKYRRSEQKQDIELTLFDGEGLISKQYAAAVDKKFCGRHVHTSFQIRMPYVKGMLHQVDFKDFLKSAGTSAITDLWGVRHPVDEVDIILTRSMFKGYGWLTENGMTWDDYHSIFQKYHHALYITNVSKPQPEPFTELNYQFLNTLSMTAEEFRPSDLPHGWRHNPAEDPRHWITKATEQQYYQLCADEQFRISYFANQDTPLGRCVKKNPLFIHESVCADELEAQAETLYQNYALGHLIVAGDNRYLSGDLLEFLTLLLDTRSVQNKKQRIFCANAVSEPFVKNSFYAPKAAYTSGKVSTLLRNPHIARNEEIQLAVFGKPSQMRKHYLGHLSDVVMVDAYMLAAERLGGADYDGDMIKTITDPLLNECVQRNYEFGSLDNLFNLPLLYIPSEEPVIRDAGDWHDRFATVRDTFSSRVGQICNAAFDRSIIAYDENSDAEIRQRCQEETETLAILTGLEIDSAKSGVKPDLEEYLRPGSAARSSFLKYKVLLDDDGDRAWYEPTAKQKLKQFMEDTDWDGISSNVERLPYLAYMLKKHTPKIKAKPAKDSELFAFAAEPGWQKKLNPIILNAVDALLKDYEAVLSRIRACRAPIRNKAKQTDIERILYARGQEDRYDTDALYARFSQLMPERVTELRCAITEQKWHLMDRPSRLEFLTDNLQEYRDYFELLSDFRFGGYRVLGDLICDIDDEINATERKKLHREADSDAFTKMMNAYENKSASISCRKAVAAVCRKQMDRIVRPSLAVQYVAALDKRRLLWELLPDKVERNVLGVKRRAR